MAANDVGPEHYKPRDGGQAHWDRAWSLYREAWFVLNITKYVERYRKKNGIKDLEKAQHYLQKLIELETADEAVKDAIECAERVIQMSGGTSKPVEQDGHVFGHVTCNYEEKA